MIFFILVMIIALAFFLRFWQLGAVPFGVTNDELGYIYNAYSIAKTGKNIFGEFLPFLTWVNIGSNPFLPVAIYLSVPLFWILDLSATTGRLIPALLGVIDVFLLYLLVKTIFKKTGLALLSSLFFAISPWHLHFSRSVYDTNYALFFILLGMNLFLYETRKGRIAVFSLICLLIAMFSYRGMNVFIAVLLFILLWYGVYVLKMAKKQVVGFVLGMGAVFLSLIFVVSLAGRGYTAEGLFFQNPKMQESIDIQIREAQGPLLIRRLFLNKPIYILTTLGENYLKGYSPEYLFLYSEPHAIYSIWSRGRVYFLDLFFIGLGIVYLYTLHKKAATFIVILVLIAGLPGMIGGFPYSARNFFLSLLIPILVAGGIVWIAKAAFLTRIRFFIISLIILSYTYTFGGYLFDYYGRYAYYASESWFKSMRDISTIINENKGDYKNVLVGSSSFSDLLQYAFYAKSDPQDVQIAWKQREKDSNESFTIGNVTFTTQCFETDKGGLPSFEGQRSLLYIVHESCAKFATPSALIKNYAGNIAWKVYTLNK